MCWYKSEAEALTAQIQAERHEAEKSYTALFLLHEKERKAHEARVAELGAWGDGLHRELDGVRNQLAALRASAGTASADECRRRVEYLTDRLATCAELASECALGIGRKHEALTTCVRAYEDVRAVTQLKE